MTGQKRMFMAVVGLAVLFGAGGFVLGQQLESPEDARAEAEAPPPSLITVPVESVALSNDVVVRGDAQFEGAVDLELDSSLGDGSSRVVTGRVPSVDAEVTEGDVLIEVSSRPVFVLEGPLPAFRELRPGLEGDDILQLETSLSRLGFFTSEPDRLYGANTEEAIRSLYESAGYDPRAASDAQESQLEAARKSVDLARESLADAQDRLNDPDTQSSLLTESRTRQSLLDAIDEAQEAVDDLNRILPSESLRSAIAALEQAEASGDENAIASAEAGLRQTHDADLRTREQAEDALEKAKQALADNDESQAAREADETEAATEAVDKATETVAEAQADLDELEEDIGVRVPVAEIVFLPSLPRTITQVNVDRGDFVQSAVMRISGTEVRINSAVSEANRPLLRVGERVIIDSESLGIEIDGEITELADRTGTNDVADTRYFMEVTPTGDYTVSDLVGINFRLKIPLEKSEGEVLAVPLAALSAGADGSSRVELWLDDDNTELVTVEPGLSDKNRSLVEITPIGRELKAGDQVVVGIEQQTSDESES